MIEPLRMIGYVAHRGFARLSFVALLIGCVFLSHGNAGAADDFERDPINYSKAKPDNAIERLQRLIDTGKVQLPFHGERGYLPGILKALEVPQSSQVLVFSKTSLQRQRISPRTPRAIYFSDDLYIGFCHEGQVLEISAVDPQLGAVFYTLEQEKVDRPELKRRTDSCTLCHASSQTRYVPGHTLRSVFPDRTGEAIFSLGSVRVNQTTALAERWGGWYVTGTHGEQTHLGNMTVANRLDRDALIKNPAGQNVTDLSEFFDVSRYQTPHSDIVALMVLEHQTEAHNLLTQANLNTRLAVHQQMILNKELGEAPDYGSAAVARRVRGVVEPLVRYLLFSGEAKLTGRLKGTSSFAADFAERGPRDAKGRSLRDFDLEQRLFKYPCSYLIYSEAFEQLPQLAKDSTYQMLYDVLTNPHYGREFSHLSADDRKAILEILRATKNDLPEYWRK